MSEFLKAKEVAEICNIGKPTAYSLIRKINEELEEEGYITIQGRVNRKRLYERLGLDADD